MYQQGAPQCDPAIFELGIPVLGICYGMHLACELLGGNVDHTPLREYGRAECRVHASEGLFAGVDQESVVWMSHGDQVTGVSENFVPLAETSTCPVAAVKHTDLPVYGLQFHPEVSHTFQGKRVLGNFVKEICGAHGTWTLGSFADEVIENLRKQVGDRRVLCGLSGGVDSAVVAALLSTAIGPQLSCILVDNGVTSEGRRLRRDRPVHQPTFAPTCTSYKRRTGSLPHWRVWTIRRKSAAGLGMHSSTALPRKLARSTAPTSWHRGRSIQT